MNDRFLRACAGEKVSPVPVWLMRQAGRYLPAYQAVRNQTDFLTLCKTPELAAEVTIQPVDILGVDAAILFSDILIPLEPMGIKLTFLEGAGPVLIPPVRTMEDLNRLRTISPKDDVPFVLETIKILRQELKDKVPLIGFAGAPFTLLTYMVEGGTTRTFLYTKRMLFEAPDMFAKLMDLLTEVTISYLKAQADAGAQAVQLFDTWGGILSRRDYLAAVKPYVSRILSELKESGIPRIYFVLDGGHLLEELKDLDAEVIGLDWRMDIKDALKRLGKEKVVQGNLDPFSLFLPEERLKERVYQILEQGREARAHIFNLGHGIMPAAPPEKAKLLVDLVHQLS